MEKTHTSHIPQSTVLDRHIPSQYQDNPQINLMTFSGTSLYINTITCFHYIAQCELSIVILKTFFFSSYSLCLECNCFSPANCFQCDGELGSASAKLSKEATHPYLSCTGEFSQKMCQSPENAPKPALQSYSFERESLQNRPSAQGSFMKLLYYTLEVHS